MPLISVRDVLRLALPPGTTVVAGSSGMARTVVWVTALRATPPAFANLHGGELALVPIAVAQALDQRLTLASLVERLAHVPIAALAVIGSVSDEACALADATGTPLLHLPDSASPHDVEREVQRLISDYEAQLDRRGAQLAHRLTQRSLAGASVLGLLETLAEHTGQAIGYYSATGELRAIKARGPAHVALQTLRPAAGGATTQLGQAVWIQPLGAGGERLGFLAIGGATLDEWDRLAARQGAAALALELAKEQAIQATEERLRGDFLQVVLDGTAADSEALLRRGQELGFELRRPHAALLCAIGETKLAHAASLIGAALNGLAIAAPMLRRAEDVLCYLPLGTPGADARSIAEQLATRLAADLPDLTCALGRPAATLAAWPGSLREAEQALLLGRDLLAGARVLDFGDLGVYRLLVLLRESPELHAFYHATLVALADYDRRQAGELLKTLEAFFANLGNLARTAAALHIHRNTLLYRLGRIAEISGHDLDDPEERLALWLALKAHRVLHAQAEPPA
jgi:purine catabolism regulator